MYTYTYSLSLATHSLIHKLKQLCTHLRNARTTGHTGTVITYEDVEIALFFGGFDGVHFFNDLKGIWPIRAQDSVVMTERRNVMSDETIEMGVKAPEMRESSSGSGSGFWKTFVNPYPSGWILEPQPEIGDDLRQRRAQVFDTNWFVTQNDFKTCNESFTYYDEDTEEIKLKHGAEQYVVFEREAREFQ